MNTLILSASRYRRRSITSMLLNPFMEGLREAGIGYTSFNTFDLNIRPCRGDLSCWFKTSGRCIQNDDMVKITALFNAANLIVISTPVYVDGIPGDLKTVFDRLVVVGNPYLEIRDGQTRHPFPINYKPKKLVLISSCGLWEIEHFDSMLYHLNAISKNLGLVSAGTLLRPHSYAMRECDIMDILAASKKAGREIAEAGYISSETQSTISREILSKHDYMELINTRADTLLKP